MTELTSVQAGEESLGAGVDRARAVSRLLDEAIPIPGTNYRVGLDPILGVLPVAGDAVAALGALYIVFEAFRARVPRSVLLKMLLLVAVGVVFDAFWKANRWNVATLEKHVEGTAK